MTEKREIDNYLPSKREEALPVKHVGCPECGGSGFIMINQPHGQPLAKRCKCYEEYLEEKNKAKWGERLKGRRT